MVTSAGRLARLAERSFRVRSVGRPQTRGVAVALTVVAVVLWPASAGLADQVRLAERIYDQVQIIGLRRGQLEFRTRRYGNVVRKPVEKVELVQVDGQVEFNRAERLFYAKNYAASIEPFERARRRAGPRRWLVDLIDLRLVVAYDMVGQFDKAVRTYIGLLERTGLQRAIVQPMHVPARGSHYNLIALSEIDRALPRLRSRQARQRLGLLRLAILQVEQEGPGRSAAGRRGKVGGRSGSPQARGSQQDDVGWSVALAQAGSLVEKGQYARAIGPIDRAISLAPMWRLDELLLLKARCQLATAGSPDDLKRAALTAMRIAIHFPRSPLVPEALLVTATVYERLGLEAKALELYGRCHGHPAASGPVAAKAAMAIERLGAARR